MTVRLAFAGILLGSALVWAALASSDADERWRRNHDCVTSGGRVVPSDWPLLTFDHCERTAK